MTSIITSLPFVQLEHLLGQIIEIGVIQGLFGSDPQVRVGLQ